MNLIDRTKIYGRAAVKALKDSVPQRQVTPKPSLDEVVDKGRRFILNNGADIGKTVASRAAKTQRNRILGITREGGQAVDDLIDLGNRGDEVMSRRRMLAEMFNKAKQHNPPKAVDPIIKIIPKPPQFSAKELCMAKFALENKLQTGLLGKHP
jgi:hypothetical protein